MSESLSKDEWLKIIKSTIFKAFLLALFPIILAVVFEEWPIYQTVWLKYLWSSITLFFAVLLISLVAVLISLKLED